jgi:hypothetical protein
LGRLATLPEAGPGPHAHCSRRGGPGSAFAYPISVITLLLCADSQYSAVSACTLIRVRFGVSRPSGNHALSGALHSCSALARSSMRTAVPETEVQAFCLLSLNETFTWGFCWIWAITSESEYAKNHRSPSNSTSCSAIGRLTCLPSAVIVVSMQIRASLTRFLTVSRFSCSVFSAMGCSSSS